MTYGFFQVIGTSWSDRDSCNVVKCMDLATGSTFDTGEYVFPAGPQAGELLVKDGERPPYFRLTDAEPEEQVLIIAALASIAQSRSCILSCDAGAMGYGGTLTTTLVRHDGRSLSVSYSDGIRSSSLIEAFKAAGVATEVEVCTLDGGGGGYYGRVAVDHRRAAPDASRP